jgi:putative endonuclease
MAGFLYILQSSTSGKFYVGSTNDLERRLAEHGRGHSLATRGRGPWRIVYREEFLTLAEARRREYEIKQWKSSRRVAELIGDINGSSGPS